MEEFTRHLVAWLLASALLVLPPVHVDGQERHARAEVPYLTQILDTAGVRPGMLVGEIGAGSGDLATAIAARVGVAGRVYANDISRAAVDAIAAASIENVVPVLGTTDDPAFPRRDFDLLIMKNSFHDLENPLSLLEAARTYLKPGGTFVLFETTVATDPLLSPVAFHNMTADQIQGIVGRSSFRVVRTGTVGTDRRMAVFVLEVDAGKVAGVWPKYVEDFRAAVAAASQTEASAAASPDRKRVVWERVADAYRDDAPGTNEDDRLREEVQARITKWSAAAVRPNEAQWAGALRSMARRLDYPDIEAIAASLGFTWSFAIRAGDYPNGYEGRTVSGDRVVADTASNLLWHQSGSAVPLDYFAAQEWIDDLNQRRYAGRSTWRMPTVDELLTLLETTPTSSAARVNAVFSDVQTMTWTADGCYPGRAWAVNFGKSMSTVWDIVKTRVAFVRPVTAWR